MSGGLGHRASRRWGLAASGTLRIGWVPFADRLGGTRILQAGWVARGSDLGLAIMAGLRGMCIGAGGLRGGWAAQARTGACGSGWGGGDRRADGCPTQRAPGPDTESAGPDTKAAGPGQESDRAPGRDKRVPGHEPLAAALAACGLQLRPACPSSGPRTPSSGPQPIRRVPPIQPAAFPLSRREPQTLVFGGKRTDDPERVRQWLLQSWARVCFSQRICFSKHARSIEIFLVKCWWHVMAQQSLTRDSATCNSKEAKLATIQPMPFCPYCLRSVLV